MTQAITLWLGFVLSIGAITWFGSKRQAIAFLLVAILTAPTAFITLGHAAPWQPTNGQYKVLGARIDVDKAIYVLLDAGNGEPRYYRLPYTAQTANQLQAAQDAAEANGTGVGMTMGGDSSPGFAEEGQRGGDTPKQPEPPALVTQ
jgi:hypothetical protein